MPVLVEALQATFPFPSQVTVPWNQPPPHAMACDTPDVPLQAWKWGRSFCFKVSRIFPRHRGSPGIRARAGCGCHSGR
jgi:hypothetical protein